MTSVALDNVSKVYPGGTVALDQLTLDVPDGEFVVLLGPSGCGKSTLLRIVAGLEEPTNGRILLDGEPADDLSPAERGVAMVFQSYALYPHLNVHDNISFPLKMAGIAPQDAASRTRNTADALRIGDLIGRRIQKLSGGQRQRVAMGRALVREPNLFLLDEPLSNIDAGQRAELRSEISGLAHELGVTVLYVTHDQTEALTMANKVAILRRGVLQDFGTPTEVYNRPATVYVAAFLGNPRMSLMRGMVRVWQERQIDLVIGNQVLQLPPDDPRAKLVSRYHGEEIVIGARPEALFPVAGGTTGNVLTGKIRLLEHHGHETLAFLDIGATAGIVDDLPPLDTSSPGGSGLWRSLTGLMSSMRHDERTPDAAQDADDQQEGRHHRRSVDLVVRLAPYPAVGEQHRLAVSVDVEALHFFNDRGRRIDVGFA